MNSQKRENLLNLSLDSTPQERVKSGILETGYDIKTKKWEVIVKYHGEIGRLNDELIQVEELTNGYAIITLPEILMDSLSGLDEIEYIEKPKSLVYNDYAVKLESCIIPVTAGSLGLQGLGVLIGIIDSGIDYFLPDFQNQNGSRILYLWDQSLEEDSKKGWRAPEGFSQGVEFNKQQIDAALATGSRGAAFNLVPERDISGHGTAVAAIAAGSSTQVRYQGIAPESDLLVVKLGPDIAGGFPRTTQMMRAVAYVQRKISLSVLKSDKETELPVSGAEFGLYAAEDIADVNGKIVVEKDTLLETAISGADGIVTFIKDYPLGSYYAKETKAPLGYVSSKEIVDFDASYQGQEIAEIAVQHDFINTPTTVEIIKTDITSGAELSGATLTVIDKDGNVVDTWTSVAGEAHAIKRLHVGESYILREEFAPYGYLQAEEISFTVSDMEEIQGVEMKDEVPTGTIIVNKDGEVLSDITLVKGHWYDFIFNYFKKSLAGATFEVYAKEDIVSPDGLDTIYYEKDELVGEIVTNDNGIAVLENLPLL